MPLAVVLGIALVASLARLGSRGFDGNVLSVLGVQATVFGFVALNLFLLARFFRSSAITLGSDGVTVKRFFTTAFYPFAKIQAARSDARGMVLTIGERELRLQIGFGRLSSAERERRDELLAEIRKGRQAATRDATEGVRFEALDRRDRSLEAWKASLASLASPEGRYREVSLAPEDLARVAEDAGTSPARRVAAAVALRSSGDDALVERVRIAATSCLDDDLRRALEEAVAEGELLEDEIAAATKRRA